ncbi:UNVERIFIED_CONTAM: Sodium transporter HKT1 [Sesamum radiatum]|uniref:Sodium transporter HKT1 n=1 Tax=Sesamum radiatum TaxID=300843 RepID=A0AAW2KNZ9_SESRA
MKRLSSSLWARLALLFTCFSSYSCDKLKHVATRLTCLLHYLLRSFMSLLVRVNPFWIELSYSISLSLLGFFVVKSTKPRTISSSFIPRDIDLFLTSMSVATVSGVSTIEMEFFSNSQLFFLSILMFVGGEAFTSMLGLLLMRAKIQHKRTADNQKTDSHSSSHSSDHIELAVVGDHAEKKNRRDQMPMQEKISNAREVLERKGLGVNLFSAFSAVSTFSNSGFMPTNENMMVFKKNSGLLLILIPQVLMGNTLYPVCLRSFIWFMEKMTKRAEFRYMLKKWRGLGYGHLLSGLHSLYLAMTVLGFIAVQLVMFCLVEWNSEATVGLSAYEKLVGSLFQVVNSRHAGETVFDLSAISPAIFVLFVLMMYLPPYTMYLPTTDRTSDEDEEEKGEGKGRFWEMICFSHLTYILIFISLVCTTERHNMKNDPLNFNVFNVGVEILRNEVMMNENEMNFGVSMYYYCSAYGYGGFTVGYSCEKLIDVKGGAAAHDCEDKWYGLEGRWTNQGKFVLILIMLFKKFTRISTNPCWRVQHI